MPALKITLIVSELGLDTVPDPDPNPNIVLALLIVAVTAVWFCTRSIDSGSRPVAAGKRAIHRAVTVRTTTSVEACAAMPRLSIAVATAVKVPGMRYMWVGARPAPCAPSPKFHMNVYGGTPPDGGGANANENTVAPARPCPAGDAAIPPGLNAGITVVVVDVEVVEVDVVVDVV